MLYRKDEKEKDGEGERRCSQKERGKEDAVFSGREEKRKEEKERGEEKKTR